MSASVFDKIEASRRVPGQRTAQWNRVTPRDAAPEWLMSALKALARLAHLAPDWDGYGSPRVRAAALQMAHRLVAILEQTPKTPPLPAPLICPVTGGGISFAWQLDARELEIEILPDGTAQYLVVTMDPATGQEEAYEGQLPLDQPAYGQQLAAWLVGG